MFLIKHSPVINILTLLLVIFLFYSYSKTLVGLDRQVFQYFYAGPIILLYVIFILVSFVWYRGDSTVLSGAKTIAHLALYMPLLMVILIQTGKYFDARHIRIKDERTQENWISNYETKHFRSTKLGIEFEYSSAPRGEQIVVNAIEIEDGVLLIGTSQAEEKYFFGKVRRLKLFPGDIEDVVGKDITEKFGCTKFYNSKRTPFALAKDLEIFDLNSACTGYYVHNTDFSSFGFKYSPRVRRLYFIKKRGEDHFTWEVMIDDIQLLVGPLEKNTLNAPAYHWYNSLYLVGNEPNNL